MQIFPSLGRKKKQNKTKHKRRLPQYFTRMAEQRSFWQRNRHRAWAWHLPPCFSLTETWMLICPFESLKTWNCCTCACLQFLIGQVCPQVWCRPYLAMIFGFFELRTFPWSPSKVEVGTFYPLTLKVRSK